MNNETLQDTNVFSYQYRQLSEVGKFIPEDSCLNLYVKPRTEYDKLQFDGKLMSGIEEKSKVKNTWKL